MTVHANSQNGILGVSVLSQKFAKEVGSLITVIPAKAGIQISLNFLDSGSRFLANAGITPARPE
jgi:hypothetical protein